VRERCGREAPADDFTQGGMISTWLYPTGDGAHGQSAISRPSRLTTAAGPFYRKSVAPLAPGEKNLTPCPAAPSSAWSLAVRCIVHQPVASAAHAIADTILVASVGIWAYIIKENRRRDEKLAALGPDYVHPDNGQLDDRDVRFRFTP
jgi:hypothetical protein